MSICPIYLTWSCWLMDEAYRYRATAGANAINELKPVLGIELTATPKTTGATPADFKNTIYAYSLSEAMEDRYVKDPVVATRKDFKPENYTPEQLERIKLEDGIHHHEYVKVGLDVYARQYDKKIVKPFVLVVAQDTEHARQLRELLESDAFFEGRTKARLPMFIPSNLVRKRIKIFSALFQLKTRMSRQKLLSMLTS